MWPAVSHKMDSRQARAMKDKKNNRISDKAVLDKLDEIIRMLHKLYDLEKSSIKWAQDLAAREQQDKRR